MKQNQNQLYPIFLRLEKLETLIVGGGLVALEKLTFLLKSSPNANVTLVAPAILPEIEMMASVFHKVVLKYKIYSTDDLNGRQVVIIATDNKELNKKIKSEASARGIIANVADTPHLCDFYLGSIVTKGDLKIAISTNGKSPTLAKRFREMLEGILPDDIGDLINNLDLIRKNLEGNFSEKVKTLNNITKKLVINYRTNTADSTPAMNESHYVFNL